MSNLSNAKRQTSPLGLNVTTLWGLLCKDQCQDKESRWTIRPFLPLCLSRLLYRECYKSTPRSFEGAMRLSSSKEPTTFGVYKFWLHDRDRPKDLYG